MDINYLTATEFPNDYKKMGDEGFSRINKLLDDSVALIKNQSKSLIIDYVGYSSMKSTKSNPVVFVILENLDRYYIDEQAIKNCRLPKVIKSH